MDPPATPFVAQIAAVVAIVCAHIEHDVDPVGGNDLGEARRHAAHETGIAHPFADDPAEIHVISIAYRVLIGRAGTPPTTVLAGTNLVTTAPAPMTQPRPGVTPSRTFTPAPIHTSSSIVMPFHAQALLADRAVGVRELVVRGHDYAMRGDTHSIADDGFTTAIQYAIGVD